MNKLVFSSALVVGLLIAAPTFAQPAGGPPPGMAGMGAMAPTEVGVITMKPETAPVTSVLPGRVIASATAQVRPQVGGVVTAVMVKEGQRVETGDLIATVDSAAYEADVAVAEASVVSAEAQLPTAEATVQRYQTLVSSGGISQAELDTANVTLAQARASLASAQAQLQTAQLTLKHSQITAPIAGVVGAVNVQVGSLLTANQVDALTTIRQIDPVDVTLSESSANLIASRSAMSAPPPSEDDTPPAPPELRVTLTLEDGSAFDQEGSVLSMDMVVSETTGTFTLRASVPNPNRILLPGMFVRATLHLADQENVYLVPQRAVTFNAAGQPTAYFVGAENKVEQRVLTATRAIDNSWVVTAGVNPGDQLIVDGLQKIQPGGEVSPLEVSLQDNGVILQEMPSAVPQMTGEMLGPTPPEGSAPMQGEAPAQGDKS